MHLLHTTAGQSEVKRRAQTAHIIFINKHLHSVCLPANFRSSGSYRMRWDSNPRRERAQTTRTVRPRMDSNGISPGFSLFAHLRRVQISHSQMHRHPWTPHKPSGFFFFPLVHGRDVSARRSLLMLMLVWPLAARAVQIGQIGFKRDRRVGVAEKQSNQNKYGVGAITPRLRNCAKSVKAHAVGIVHARKTKCIKETHTLRVWGCWVFPPSLSPLPSSQSCSAASRAGRHRHSGSMRRVLWLLSRSARQCARCLQRISECVRVFAFNHSTVRQCIRKSSWQPGTLHTHTHTGTRWFLALGLLEQRA